MAQEIFRLSLVRNLFRRGDEFAGYVIAKSADDMIADDMIAWLAENKITSRGGATEVQVVSVDENGYAAYQLQDVKSLRINIPMTAEGDLFDEVHQASVIRTEDDFRRELLEMPGPG